MKQRLLRWYIAGVVAIILLGGIFHFIFEFSGGWEPLGAFVPVNESPWEHLKLTFWPGVVYFAASYPFISAFKRNYLPAAAASLYAMPVIILSLFYGYTELTGYESVIVDIGIFIISVIGGQYAAYRIQKGKPLAPGLSWWSLAALTVLAAIYAFFTWYAPEIHPFRDSTSGSYGIPK